jgi:4-diphosphocytidyl-2-C-methyl-D-erythritol kinase
MSEMSPTVQIRAPAKINLSLEITGRRPDGYHELVSIMQTVSLADILTLSLAEDVTVTVRGATLGADNLVTLAAELLRRRHNIGAGCAIILDKRIPIAAGLGGGSSDAAATLLSLCRLWNLELEPAELCDLAAQLGSDVPFFLQGGTSLIEGRGEVVTALPTPRPVWYLLVNPGFPVSTPAVYASLQHSDWTDGMMTRTLAERMKPGSHAPFGRNALESALFRVSPEARACLDAVAEVAAGRALVSGSGPTIFAEFEEAEPAATSCAALRRHGYWSEVTQAIAPREAITACV